MQIAKSDILRHFDELPTRIYKPADLAAILAEKRKFWRLVQSNNTLAFIKFLLRTGRLIEHKFGFPRPLLTYTWGEVPLLQILLTLRPRSFLSHYTAVRVHGLTEQVPKTVYVTHEPAVMHPRRSSELTQDAIDAAFQKPARISLDVAPYGDLRICMVNGLATEELGVADTTTHDDLGETVQVRVTNLERTMIDITVRPSYAGGAAEVLQAFREARNKLSVNRLRAMLQKLGHVYPYHQALGFYLERAGYAASAIELFHELPRPFRFHLANAMGETDYIEKWNLYIPKGL
jgi:hypothetical protein